MNQFVKAMTNVAYTENGMPVYASTLDSHLDLFYRIGLRDSYDKLTLMKEAYEANKNLAVKIIGWSRSIRQGAGVRDNFRLALKSVLDLNEVDFSWFARQGYWKDIFHFSPSELPLDEILPLIKSSLDDNLLLKWLPRKKKVKAHKNNEWVSVIRKSLGITEKEYRKLVSKYVSTETLITQKRFSEINYSHVPSKSMQRNRKVFIKFDGKRFNEFINKAISKSDPKVKVNAGAVYPHEILKMIYDGVGTSWRHVNNNNVAQAQWNNLPNVFTSNKKIMVVGDTSASMTGDNAILISLALTIYLSERLTGAFHNFAVTFSSRPSFIRFKDSDTLADKLKRIPAIIESTDIEAVIDLIVHKAKTENIPAEDMPEMILIISDMQFNRGVVNRNENFGDILKRKYAELNLPVPAICYWNVRNSHGTPVTAGSNGVVLFSGMSPNSISQALGGELDPITAMLRVVNKDDFYFLKR